MALEWTNEACKIRSSSSLTQTCTIICRPGGEVFNSNLLMNFLSCVVDRPTREKIQQRVNIALVRLAIAGVVIIRQPSLSH